MAKKSAPREDGFDRLARLIKEEGEEIRADLRGEMSAMEKRLERHMDEGFSAVNSRLDTVIQVQLEEHAGRLRKLEDTVFTR